MNFFRRLFGLRKKVTVRITCLDEDGCIDGYNIRVYEDEADKYGGEIIS